MSERDRIVDDLTKIAWSASDPFCYSCYRIAPSGTCAYCGSDDLMRHVAGVGVEYGIEWVVEHLTKDSLTPIDLDGAFEDSICECYADTVKIGWIETDVATAIKSLDPTSWRIAQADWVDQILEDGSAVSFDNGATCYWTHDTAEPSSKI